MVAAARCMLSAAHKSSGKTTVTLGLAAAFAARGLALQTFKKGPDYIDPMWLALASGRPCFNLDTHLSNEAAVRARFSQAASTADLSLVEGNKGLYDGLALDGSNSNAALARFLGLPVVLVIDARGMTRGVAPLILGYQAFERDIHIGGVILNRLGGSRHEAKLRAVIEHYTDVPVLGAIQHDERLAVTERHLGLVPAAELDDAALRVRA
ncbi:MAG: AAA family ATPase, partial [Rubrivivax sp.]|nr:AAA family ATPase [Rubrivivax sp.]